LEFRALSRSRFCQGRPRDVHVQVTVIIPSIRLSAIAIYHFYSLYFFFIVSLWHNSYLRCDIISTIAKMMTLYRGLVASSNSYKTPLYKLRATGGKYKKIRRFFHLRRFSKICWKLFLRTIFSWWIKGKSYATRKGGEESIKRKEEGRFRLTGTININSFQIIWIINKFPFEYCDILVNCNECEQYVKKSNIMNTQITFYVMHFINIACFVINHNIDWTF